MMTISEKVAYLKGLADGLELDKEPSKEGKILAQVISILEDVGMAVEDLEDEIEAVDCEIDMLSESVSDLETIVFDEDDEDDDCCGDDCCCCCGSDEDDFFEIACPECGKDIIIDESVLDLCEVTCPGCNNRFALDLTDDDETAEKE